MTMQTKYLIKKEKKTSNSCAV